jgi:beta-lactamase superfamily II metal-dependent hydrolase
MALLLVLLQLEVAFVDVGQGDAALITSPAGRTVLVDGGPPESAPALERFLREHARAPIDLVVLTHRHLDHLGGLERAIEALGARAFLESGFAHDERAWRSLVRMLAARRIPVSEATSGRRIDLGGDATLTLLGPPSPPILRSRSDTNANSIVSRLDWRRTSVLLEADAEAPTERWLLQRRAPLAARVLKVAHHGSHHASGPRFLRAVHPELAVVSVGARNDYGHPAPITLARLRALGARVLRTDEDGDVIVRTADGESLDVRIVSKSAATRSSCRRPSCVD